MAKVPNGSVLRLQLDGAPIDLIESRLESWTHDVPKAAVELVFLIPADDSPKQGTPLRLTLRLSGASQVVETGRWATNEYDPTMQVDAMYWTGGTLTARAWSLKRRVDGEFDRHRWELQVEAPSSIFALAENLDPARPPYLLLMAEVCTDGVWDIATGDATIKVDVDLDDLALSPELKQRIRHWNDEGFETDDDAELIATAIRSELPGTTVFIR